jgi:2-keto-4-pentenoate hydratase/2-oxohepta-3-ene-1,7-dioic acid hydratase in catechol pathway
MVPIDRPGKIICVGLNYRDHAEEQGVDLPKAPLFFAKYTTSLIGPGDPIVIPSVVEQCDYEAELGVVIGETVKNVSKENVSRPRLPRGERRLGADLQFADVLDARKSPDTFCQ